ncbi:MAG: hypothetical protein ACYC6N_29050, partial [Pirellulaceae bacterium]
MIPVILCAWMAIADDSTTQVNQLGPVTVTTTLSPAEPAIGDEITLEIRAEAEPQVEVLMPEFGEALSRYTILNFVPRQRIDDQGKTISSQVYTLQPYLSGPQSIPPILVEFVDHRPEQKPAPDDFDAYEILTDRIDFQVRSVLPEDAARELKPPLGELDLVTDRSRSDVLWLITGTLVLLSAGAAAWVLLRQRRQRARRRNAYEVARARLDRRLSRPWPQDPMAVESFFVVISSIVRRYLEDRFELRAPELTTEEFLALAGSANHLSRDHQHLLRDFLRQADLVKFAGVQASETEIRLSSDLAARFLEETRENAPLIEDAEALLFPPND